MDSVLVPVQSFNPHHNSKTIYTDIPKEKQERYFILER